MIGWASREQLSALRETTSFLAVSRLPLSSGPCNTYRYSVHSSHGTHAHGPRPRPPRCLVPRVCALSIDSTYPHTLSADAGLRRAPRARTGRPLDPSSSAEVRTAACTLLPLEELVAVFVSVSLTLPSLTASPAQSALQASHACAASRAVVPSPSSAPPPSSRACAVGSGYPQRPPWSPA